MTTDTTGISISSAADIIMVIANHADIIRQHNTTITTTQRRYTLSLRK